MPVTGVRGTSNSDWARHTDLSAGSVGPSRGSADCARRSPGDASKDAGSIPATSTTPVVARAPVGSPTGALVCPASARPVRCRAGSVGRTSPGRGAHATPGPSHAGPVAKPHPAVRRPRHQRVVSEANEASTTAAEDVTRGRPTARSRTGRRCASRTAGRSCRPDSRADRRPGVAGRRSEIRTGTAVASESWADARSRRFRREGAYGPARQACAAGAGVLMSRSMGSRASGALPATVERLLDSAERALRPSRAGRRPGFEPVAMYRGGRCTARHVRPAVVRSARAASGALGLVSGPRWVVSPARLHFSKIPPPGVLAKGRDPVGEKAGATADSGGPGLRFPAPPHRSESLLGGCSACVARPVRSRPVRPHTCCLRPFR